MRELSKIIEVAFPEDQFYKQEYTKRQIVLHHTVSGGTAEGDYKSWLSNKERVATAQIVQRDGTCVQLFSSKYWAHHLGTKAANNLLLNQQSIGIEIDSWGGLTYDKVKGVFLSFTGAVVPKEKVVHYPKGFRGYFFYEKYTDEQIEAVAKLILFWSDTYKIPLKYNEDMWDLSSKAMAGDPGIFTHVSYRKDKSDCHPQPELIEKLKSLSK